MSLETWKEEFYPIPANENMEDMEALLNAKRKWEGMRKENLEKHECNVKTGRINYNAEFFCIGAGSCALCLKYSPEYEETLNKYVCDQCPIYLSRDEISCDNLSQEEIDLQKYSDNEIHSPWHEFTNNNNPELMLQAIDIAIEYLSKQNNE